jgi:prepilin-type N-terminal cleavage/methylation domain-containing protein
MMKKLRGFTLIELLIVIAIVGVVASFVSTVLGLEGSDGTTCVGGMKHSVQTGAQIFGTNGGGVECGGGK